MTDPSLPPTAPPITTKRIVSNTIRKNVRVLFIVHHPPHAFEYPPSCPVIPEGL
jgi:hypothetical protein